MSMANLVMTGDDGSEMVMHLDSYGDSWVNMKDAEGDETVSMTKVHAALLAPVLARVWDVAIPLLEHSDSVAGPTERVTALDYREDE